MNHQQDGVGGGVAPAISDEQTPEWFKKMHDRIYRNIDFYVPSLDPTGRYQIHVRNNSYTPLLQVIRYQPHKPLPSSEHYKLDTAAGARIKFGLPHFPLIINRLQDLTPRIRAFYHHRKLAVSDHHLACIMAIDGLFLLDLLINYREKKETLALLRRDPSEHGSLIRDILSPHNKFPLFVLEEIISLTGNPTDRNLFLTERLLEFCSDVSPFQQPLVYPEKEIYQPRHLLDLLYFLLVQPAERRNSNSNSRRHRSNSNPNPNSRESPSRRTSFAMRLADAAFELMGIPRLLREQREKRRTLTPSADRLNKYAGIRFQGVGGFDAMRFDADRGVMYLREVDLRKPHSGDVVRILLQYESYSVSDKSKRVLQRYHALMGSLGYYESSLQRASVVLPPQGPPYDYEFGCGKVHSTCEAAERKRKKSGRRMDKVGEMVEEVNSYYEGSFGVRWRMMGQALCPRCLCT